MNSKKKQLLIALVIGLVALFLNQAYISSRISDVQETKFVKIMKAKKPIQAGATLTQSMVEMGEVPQRFAPKAAIKWSDGQLYFGQEIGADVDSGDYVLENFFSSSGTVGYKLSEQIEGEGNRAVTIPVDETNSLSRSIVAGDHIDILFSFNIPGIAQKISVMLLQNILVVATGSYSAAEQELGAKSGGAKRYGTITLLLGGKDAGRLISAKQSGQISIILRNSKDQTPLEMPPLAGVKDILSPADRGAIETMLKNMATAPDSGEKLKEQIKDILETQRNQMKR